MMESTRASKWRHKADRDRAATKAVEAVMVERKEIRLVKAIHLVTRVQVRINLGKGNKWRCKLMLAAKRATAMTMQCKLKAVARRATAMMMVTRLWREPGTRHMILEWRIGWGLAHWTRMISA